MIPGASLRRLSADDGHERGKHDRIISWIHLGQLLKVGRDGPRSCSGWSLCPRIDELEPCRPNESREQCADVGVFGVGHRHREAADTSGGRDRFLGDEVAAWSKDRRHPTKDHRWIAHVHQEKSAESEVDGLWQAEVLSGLGDREHLRLPCSSSCRRDGISRARVAVDGVDATGPADEPCEGD